MDKTNEFPSLFLSYIINKCRLKNVVGANRLICSTKAHMCTGPWSYSINFRVLKESYQQMMIENMLNHHVYIQQLNIQPCKAVM